MDPRIEVFCSIDPEDGREFVCVMTWHRTDEKGRLFPLTHANFYGESAREARERAEGWLEQERAKEAQRAAANERRAASVRLRKQEVAA